VSGASLITSDDVSGMAAVARAASAFGAPRERAEEVLAALTRLVPYECAEFSVWDAVSEQHRPFTNAGYRPELVQYFGGDAFQDEVEAFRARATSRPIRMRDLPCEPASVTSIAEVLWPEGFKEGMTFCLHVADGRYVGLLNMSTCDAAHPSDSARAAIGMLGGTLANTLDASRFMRCLIEWAEPDAAAVVIGADAGAMALPGMRTDPLLDSDDGPVDVVRQLLQAGESPTRFLWPAIEGPGWRPVRVLPCNDPELTEGIAVVALGQTTAVHGLTRRELEVLSLIARGWSNPQVADHFVISQRTVGTHVARILEKLEESTRAGAAGRAVREGLLLPLVEQQPDCPW
jgi:DNA-binding CsgD family transcriptional regulator